MLDAGYCTESLGSIFFIKLPEFLISSSIQELESSILRALTTDCGQYLIMKHLFLFRIIAVFFLAAMLAMFFAGCAVKKYPLEKLSASSYPGFTDDMLYDGLEHSILQSIKYLKQIPSESTFRF